MLKKVCIDRVLPSSQVNVSNTANSAMASLPFTCVWIDPADAAAAQIVGAASAAKTTIARFNRLLISILSLPSARSLFRAALYRTWLGDGPVRRG